MQHARFTGRRMLLGAAVVVVALVASGCQPFAAPGDTSKIQLVSSTVQSGYRIEFYRNTAYPCAISGYQTFAIGYRETQATTAARPLWVHLHGGGVGWFDAAGQPKPNTSHMSEENLDALLNNSAGGVLTPGLMQQVFADPAEFRVLAVSGCDRDLYGGGGKLDPNNPNLAPDGTAIRTNGLHATKAAIQFSRNRFATTKMIVSGVSAGSIGSYHVAWSLQLQGIAPAGIIADSFVMNQEWSQAVIDQQIPCPTGYAVGAPTTSTELAAIRARLHPRIANVANQPDMVVADGRLTVPVMQVWSPGDPFGCGATLMDCTLRDGTVVTIGSVDCVNEPLRQAIAAQGPTSRSKSLRLCVQNPEFPLIPCSGHGMIMIAGVNTDPAFPADYNTAIMDWARARLADP